MSTTQVLRDAPFAPAEQPHASLTRRIDALPASVGLWSFITLLALGGFFELYDLFFKTGYISTGLLAEHIFHTDQQGILASPIRPHLPRPLLRIVYRRQSAGAAGGQAGPPIDLYVCAGPVWRIFTADGFPEQRRRGHLVPLSGRYWLGIELVTIDTYLSEWVPTHLRNKAFAFAFYPVSLGSRRGADVMDAGPDDAVRPDRLALGDYLWRALFADHLGDPQNCRNRPAG